MNAILYFYNYLALKNIITFQSNKLKYLHQRKCLKVLKHYQSFTSLNLSRFFLFWQTLMSHSFDTLWQMWLELDKLFMDFEAFFRFHIIMIQPNALYNKWVTNDILFNARFVYTVIEYDWRILLVFNLLIQGLSVHMYVIIL